MSDTDIEMASTTGSESSTAEDTAEVARPLADQPWEVCCLCFRPMHTREMNTIKTHWGATWYACSTALQEYEDEESVCFMRIMRQITSFKAILPKRWFVMRTERNNKSDERLVFSSVEEMHLVYDRQLGEEDKFQWGIWTGANWPQADREYWLQHGYVRGSSRAKARKATDDFEADSELFWECSFEDCLNNYQNGNNGCFSEASERKALSWRIPEEHQRLRRDTIIKAAQVFRSASMQQQDLKIR